MFSFSHPPCHSPWVDKPHPSLSPSKQASKLRSEFPRDQHCPSPWGSLGSTEERGRRWHHGADIGGASTTPNGEELDRQQCDSTDDIVVCTGDGGGICCPANAICSCCSPSCCGGRGGGRDTVGGPCLQTLLQPRGKSTKEEDRHLGHRLHGYASAGGP